MDGSSQASQQQRWNLHPYHRQSRGGSMDVELLPTVGPGDLDHYPISPLPDSFSMVDVDDDGRPKPVERERFGEALAPAVPNWPAEARFLDRPSWRKFLGIFMDVLYLVPPLLFLILGAKAVNLDGKPVTSKGENVRRVCWLEAPTIFPVVFAAIAWRLLRVTAMYKAEKGGRLGTLEQLNGSRTFYGTLETHFSLQSFNFLAIGLIVLWTLSPLGSQASLRVLMVSDRSSPFTRALSYLSTNQTSVLADQNNVDSYRFAVDSLYSASLLPAGSNGYSGIDMWGNVKIPLYESLDSTGVSSGSWLSVDKSNTTYSSLVGIPITDLPRRGQATISIESSYFVFACPVITKIAQDKNLKAILGPVHGGERFSNIWGERQAGFFLDTTTPFNRMIAAPQRGDPITLRRVVFGSLGPQNWVTIANCSIQRSSVESAVTCVDRDCYVSKIRKSTQDGRAGGVTPFEDSTTCTNLFKSFAESTGSSPKFSSTPTEQYMNDPSSTKSAFFSSSLVDLSPLRQELLERRLSLLFNTYWQASLAPWYLTGGATRNLSLQQSTPSLQTIATPASIILSAEIYYCKRLWLGMLLLSSLVMLFCGIATVMLHYRVLAPDMLGHVSSLTRENRYTPLPPGGCALDGAARTRLLKNLRVRIEDVKWREGVGHITLSSVRGPADNVGMLRKRRLYTGIGLDG
ncbi:MAG: hypothetical protein M1835_006800 [Candelina submexicana]|nr:MAG: hypothetical protein M1835_006800 [Candelina submexicana]